MTNLELADITVTGGSAMGLTGSGTDWVLSVRAGAAGTLRVSVAEDAVTEGPTRKHQQISLSTRSQLRQLRSTRQASETAEPLPLHYMERNRYGLRAGGSLRKCWHIVQFRGQW